MPALGGMWPAPVLEPRPQEGTRRHTGEAYELVLDPVVPQLGRDLTVLPDPGARQFTEGLDLVGGVCGLDFSRGLQDVLVQAAEHQKRQREQEDGGSRSSNKGKKGKKRKRRKKKLPKGSSSSFPLDLRGGAGDQDTMFDYAEDENVEVAGVHWWSGDCSLHGRDDKFIEEKVVWTEEFIHKHGQLAKTTYGDRVHLYTQSSECYWLDWTKEWWLYVRRMGCPPWRWTGMMLTSTYGQVCYEEWVEQTWSGAAFSRKERPSDKTVKALI